VDSGARRRYQIALERALHGVVRVNSTRVPGCGVGGPCWSGWRSAPGELPGGFTRDGVEALLFGVLRGAGDVPPIATSNVKKAHEVFMVSCKTC
jgi:hypothetical protein